MSTTKAQTTVGLTPARILKAATDLIATEGFGGLSMRKLAERLDCAAMSLYRYFATKEELLSALADQFVAEIDLPSPELPWDQQIVDYLLDVAALFDRHPEFAEIAARQHLNSEAAFRGVEVMLAALRSAGLDADQAVSAWLALTFFTVGFAQRRASARKDDGRSAQRRRNIASLPRDDFAHFHEIATVYVGELSDRDFVAALRVTLAGVAAMGTPTQ